MIRLHPITTKQFLTEYWQKKPLVIRQALQGFVNPLPADELAGLALEEDIESRIVYETPNKNPQWHLQRGPFTEDDFANLPPDRWTLLVQGVDRIIPEVYKLLDEFNFIPQWRIDDVMISYATKFGSVGPHYDNYDVFLFQAQGQREWSLTTKKCTPDNHVAQLDLRIMQEFDIEERFVLEEGDMLYLPPHVGHYGIALTDECMTYSFGYRSYTGQELLDSLSEYAAEQGLFQSLYEDPDWSTLANTSELPDSAWQQARKLMVQMLDNKDLMKSWFGCFATQLDQQAEQHLPHPIEDEVCLQDFLDELQESDGLIRDSCSRFAYNDSSSLYINGVEWAFDAASRELLCLIANHRFISLQTLKPYLDSEANQRFLFELWKLQWLCSAN